MRAPNCATGPRFGKGTPNPSMGSGSRSDGAERVSWPRPSDSPSVALEEPPDARPRIALLGGVLRLPRPHVDAPIERVAADRMVVHLRHRQLRLLAPAAPRRAACLLRCSRPRRCARRAPAAESAADRPETAATDPCTPRGRSDGDPPNRFGRVDQRALLLDALARRDARGDSSPARSPPPRRTSPGFRKMDSSVISPPWLQPMMPIRAGIDLADTSSAARPPPSPHRPLRGRRSRSRRRTPRRTRCCRDTPAR